MDQCKLSATSSVTLTADAKSHHGRRLERDKNRFNMILLLANNMVVVVVVVAVAIIITVVSFGARK